MDVWAITVVDHLCNRRNCLVRTDFVSRLEIYSSNYRDSMMLEGLFEIVSHLSSWDCTIKTVDWRVNCGSLDVVFDEASQHNCRVNFGLDHDQAASIFLDLVDGKESFVSFGMDLISGLVLNSAKGKKFL